MPGGILFHTQDPDRVFVSVCPADKICTLDEYAYSGRAFGFVRTVASSGVANARMRVFNPIMDADGALLLFNRGYMLADSYNYYNVDADAVPAEIQDGAGR